MAPVESPGLCTELSAPALVWGRCWEQISAHLWNGGCATAPQMWMSTAVLILVQLKCISLLHLHLSAQMD